MTFLALLLVFLTPDQAIWNDYGLVETQQNGKTTLYRFKDPTGAYAAKLWQGGTQYNNYLIQGPPIDVKTLQNVRGGPVPSLADHLPEKGRVPSSERHVVSSATLARFCPELPAEVVGFDMGAEGSVIDYKGGIRLALLEYPTPQIARRRLPGFERLQGAQARRLGPFVAVAFSTAPEAAKLLSEVRYEGKITLSERVPTAKDNPGEMLVVIFQMTGLALIPCVVVGLIFGFIRGWWNWRSNADPMTLLHLGDRQ